MIKVIGWLSYTDLALQVLCGGFPDFGHYGIGKQFGLTKKMNLLRCRRATIEICCIAVLNSDWFCRMRCWADGICSGRCCSHCDNISGVLLTKRKQMVFANLRANSY